MLKLYPDALALLSQALAEFGREDELITIILAAPPGRFGSVIEVLFRPPFRELHYDPRFIAVAQRLGLLDYWRQSGAWPDFCYIPDLPYDCKAEAAKLR